MPREMPLLNDLAKNSQVISVDELTFYLKDLIENNPLLRNIAVKGEIIEIKRHNSGHVYFSIGSKQARLSCVMFKSNANYVPLWPQTGDEVIVQGYIGIYPPQGTYQLYARNILPLGKGAQMRAKEELKKRLEKEGLFDPRIKRKLPPYPNKVGVVTSQTGAAVKDVIRVAKKRFPQCVIYIFPALVQGIEAPQDIVRAMQLSATKELDAVLLVRGGGSRDDLAPFDDERVVRSIRACPFPVVTGVGHEIDWTLSDLAADLRASTPSAAAEIVFPDRNEIYKQTYHMKARLVSLAAHRCQREFNLCERQLTRLQNTIKNLYLYPASLEVAQKAQTLSQSTSKIIANMKERLTHAAASLDALSPLKSLSRGWITCLSEEEKSITSIHQVEVGDKVFLCMIDGRVKTEVKSLHPKGK